MIDFGRPSELRDQYVYRLTSVGLRALDFHALVFHLLYRRAIVFDGMRNDTVVSLYDDLRLIR